MEMMELPSSTFMILTPCVARPRTLTSLALMRMMTPLELIISSSSSSSTTIAPISLPVFLNFALS